MGETLGGFQVFSLRFFLVALIDNLMGWGAFVKKPVCQCEIFRVVLVVVGVMFLAFPL